MSTAKTVPTPAPNVRCGRIFSTARNARCSGTPTRAMRFCLDMNQGGAMVDLASVCRQADPSLRCGHESQSGCLVSVPGAVALPRGILHPLRRRRRCQELQDRSRQANRWIYAPAAHSHPSRKKAIPASSRLTRSRLSLLDFSIRVQIDFPFDGRHGEVEIIRKGARFHRPEADISIDEYITACYGTTEYPEDMTGIRLSLTGADKTESIDYAYQCREAEVENVQCAEALIPQVDTRLSMRADAAASGYFREGFSFSPMYTLGIKKTVKAKGELRTWLKVAKAS